MICKFKLNSVIRQFKLIKRSNAFFTIFEALTQYAVDEKLPIYPDRTRHVQFYASPAARPGIQWRDDGGMHWLAGCRRYLQWLS